jgi:hypothetical protein
MTRALHSQEHYINFQVQLQPTKQPPLMSVFQKTNGLLHKYLTNHQN